MKTGVVDVGGGLRDIYGSGVFDYLLEKNIHFDVCFGVSAGSANISSYLSGQAGRNYVFYTEYSFRREYMSPGNWIRTRNYLDLDYIYGTLSNSDGEYPLDYPAAASNPAIFKIVATESWSGRPCYFDFKDTKQDDYGAIKASCCVPVVNRPYIVDGNEYFDGGISDPVPFQKCFDLGCDKVVLILTKPKDFRRLPEDDKWSVRLLRKKYPASARAMEKRAETYNKELDQAAELEKQGKLLIVAPDDIGGMKTLTKNRQKMDRLYRKGKKDAERIPAFLAAD